MGNPSLSLTVVSGAGTQDSCWEHLGPVGGPFASCCLSPRSRNAGRCESGHRQDKRGVVAACEACAGHCVQMAAARPTLLLCLSHTLGGPSPLHPQPSGRLGTPEGPCARLCRLNPQGSSTFCGYLRAEAPGHLHPEEDAHPRGRPTPAPCSVVFVTPEAPTFSPSLHVGQRLCEPGGSAAVATRTCPMGLRGSGQLVPASPSLLGHSGREVCFLRM